MIVITGLLFLSLTQINKFDILNMKYVVNYRVLNKNIYYFSQDLS